MDHLTPHNIFILFLSFGILLGTARILGEIAQRFHQPAVLGELLAGLVLGPTILGMIFPVWNATLFPAAGPNTIALETISTLAVVMFLLVAGLEVDLSMIWKQGKVAPRVSISGIIFPFVLGFGIASVAPNALGMHEGADPLIFALFLATALSISALPVIAKTLMDLDLYRSDLGMIVISAAMFDDLVGWIIFAVILGMIGSTASHVNSVLFTTLSTLAFAGLMLTAGRWLLHKFLPYLQAYTRWPGGVLSFILILALFGAAFTEWIGIHAIFGSFIVGVALGDSTHLRERTRVIIDQFVSFIFAPVFFASIGLKVNFVTHFDGLLVFLVLIIACVFKLAGGYIGARWGRLPVRDAWAIGFAMNARGAMEIILGLLALQAGIISHRLFVALYIMAIVTSMLSGPMMRLILQHTKKRYLADVMAAKHFLANIKSVSRREAINELIEIACDGSNLMPDQVDAAVWKREATLATGIGNGVAVPHTRIAGLAKSIVVAGLSDSGIDFDAPDGKPANVLFLILTPEEMPNEQLQITAEIARIFRSSTMSERALRARTYTEFLALMKGASFESRQRKNIFGAAG